jgi:RHS repeat-associated protein
VKQPSGNYRNHCPDFAKYATTGTATQNLRFPGQYFLIEQGLAYNWHRFYDATTGRYTQPDPLGFPDGPSRYTYALNSPLMKTDPLGLETYVIIGYPTSGNPFGHVAIGFPKTNSVFSFGTDPRYSTSLDSYLEHQSTYRNSVVYSIPTTPQQEQCIAACLSASYPPLPSPTNDSGGALQDNCATRSNNCLHQCGVGSKYSSYSFPTGTQTFARRRATRTFGVWKMSPIN